jgi:hypothetical protein
MAGGETYDGITVPEGDPGALEATAGRLRATAGMLDTVSSALSGLIGGLGWLGPASVSHASLTTTQGAMATTASGSLLEQAGVINGYGRMLEQAQRQAKKAIEHARDADRRIKQAKADIAKAQLDEADAQARIVAAQTAQSVAKMQLFTDVADALAGHGAANAALHAAEQAEADARRDLHDAQERERDARRRLEHAENDLRDAKRDGAETDEAIGLARTALVAAAQGAGLLPTQPGGPADPAFAAAAGIILPKPPPPPKPEHKHWWQSALDDVGHAASWTWDQAKQIPGGAWDGVKGMYEGGKFLVSLNPMDPNNLMHPGQLLHRYEQLGQAGKFAFQHPGEFGKQLINWDDLSHGRYGHWLGNLLPDAALAVATGGAGTVVSRSVRVAKATDKLVEGERALSRAASIQERMPLKRFREEKTVAAQAGNDGRISISGEDTAKQEQMLQRIGENPDLLQRQSSADLQQQFAGVHDMPPHGIDKAQGQPAGWYYGTHAELKIAVHDPATPVGVTRAPCGPSCDPALQKLATHTHHDIVVSHPGQTVLYRSDGTVIPNPGPLDFSGINSRWPGLLSGAGAGALGLGAPALPSP